MADNLKIYPKAVHVNLDRSYSTLLGEGALKLGKTAYEHKFKSVVIAACLFGSFKAYGVYKTFRGVFSLGSGNEKNEAS